MTISPPPNRPLLLLALPKPTDKPLYYIALLIAVLSAVSTQLDAFPAVVHVLAAIVAVLNVLFAYLQNPA